MAGRNQGGREQSIRRARRRGRNPPAAGAGPEDQGFQAIRNLRTIGLSRGTFVELPAFARHREEYLDDEGFRGLQAALIANPTAGDVIEGAGGLRKLRSADPRRGKGRRGGLRVIYFWWPAGEEFWLFTVYDKDEAADLTAVERAVLRNRLRSELETRRKG